MNKKEAALTMIRQRGACSQPVFIECAICLIYPACKGLQTQRKAGSKGSWDAYKIAVNTYIAEYGKDADLLEVLI